MDVVAMIDSVVASQNALDADKAQKRASARDYLRAAIKAFNFEPYELFDELRPQFRDGTVKYCRDLFKSNPSIERQAFLKKATSDGINPLTASTQFSRFKRMHQEGKL